MTDRAAAERPDDRIGRLRPWLALLGVLAVVGAVAAPLSSTAMRSGWGEAIEFSLLGLAAPALLTLGAPWRFLGAGPRAGALADRRARHPELVRSVGFVGLDLLVMVLWLTPGGLGALVRRPGLVAVEAVTLVIAGVGLWAELVESPPLVPRSSRPRRAVLAAVAMWTVWTVAYLIAMAHRAWYAQLPHAAGLSAAADRQVSSAILWAAAAFAFFPVVFWNLVQWLQGEEDPDQELFRLVRESRRSPGWPDDAGDAGHGPAA